MQISVNIQNNTIRKNVIVDSSSSVRSVLEGEGIDYSKSAPSLDGSTLAAGQLDKSFDEFGIKEKCFLSCIQKMDNAR